MVKRLDPEHVLLALAIVACAVVVIVVACLGKASELAKLLVAVGGVGGLTGLRALIKPSPKLGLSEPFGRDDLGLPTPGVPVTIASTSEPEPATAEASMTVTPRIFAQALLGQLGAPLSANNVQSLIAAQALEGGFMHNGATYNPLNTTMGAPGAVSVTSVGVKAYPSWAVGLEATARTLKNGLYNDVLAALARSAPPDETLRVIELSPWGWYHIENGQKVVNPIQPAANLQYEADKPYPAGGGGLGVALGGSAVALLLLGGAGVLWAWGTGRI